MTKILSINKDFFCAIGKVNCFSFADYLLNQVSLATMDAQKERHWGKSILVPKVSEIKKTQ
jgi:hypothetical protein